MWVEKRRSWIATVILGGFALPHILTRTLIVTGLSVLVTLAHLKVPALHFSLTNTPFTLIGLPLGIFLGFRNSAAYDRFWEGRRAWGSLVNTSRSLARQVLTLLEEEPAASDKDEVRTFEVQFVHTQIAYVHALRHHLRGQDPFSALEDLLPADDVAKLQGDHNVPIAILRRMGEHVAFARRRGWLHVLHLPILEQSLTSLTDIQGGCERIKSTPVPYSYTVLMHRIVGLYCVLLPFGLADTVGWATPAVVLAISYALFGLDAIGEEIEQPFGTDINDLPLKAISHTIESDLRRSLGEPPPEAPLQPRKGVLS